MEPINWETEFLDEEGDIYIRPMTLEDVDYIVKWRNSENVKKYFIYRGLFTHENQVKYFNDHIATGEVAQMIIMLKTSKSDTEVSQEACLNKQQEKSGFLPVGCVNIKDLDFENKKGEYGIYIGEDEARGKGVGTKAAKLMLKYGFENLELHRIYLRVLDGNERAIKSYEKAGFVKEGFLVDDVMIEGEYRSIYWMAAINGAK